jgi:hypothetical protein
MRYVSYREASALPNVVVDGRATTNTVLTLSHWPKSGTPGDLKADTSAEIVFRYLDRPDLHVEAGVVSNNHYDEDGLVGIFAMVDPDAAAPLRDLLIDVSYAGDFGVWTERDAARIALTLAAYADRETSPLARSLFTLPYADLADALYRELLGVLPQVVRRVRDYRSLWQEADDEMTETARLIDRGVITIEEQRDLDFAVVRGPETGSYHPFVLHTRTQCTRLLIIRGSSVEVRYRYEGWVQLVSRKPSPRVDLTDLAEQLNHDERSGGHWVFEGVDAITPSLLLEGNSATSIDPDRIRRLVEHQLRTGAPAWNPYD